MILRPAGVKVHLALGHGHANFKVRLIRLERKRHRWIMFYMEWLECPLSRRICGHV